MTLRTRTRACLAALAIGAGLCMSAGALAQGTAPYVSNGMVISQIWGGGGNVALSPNADYVELYNRGSSAVNIAGWSVQVATATGTTWQVVDISSTLVSGRSTIVPPGGYFLVRLESPFTTGTSLNPDAAGSGATNLSSGSGKVALVNNTTALTGSCPTTATIVDFVGYGSTANCKEGATVAPGGTTTSPGTGMFRKQCGAQDTGVNGTDFQLITPNVFRNSLTTGASAGTAATSAGAQVGQGASGTLTVTTGSIGDCTAATVTGITGNFSSVGGGSSVTFTGGPTSWTGNFTVSAGTPVGTYTIPLTVSTSAGSFVTSAPVVVTPPPPANDNCSGALVITSFPYSSGPVAVDSATDDTNANPSCDSSSNTAGARQGVWFKYTTGATPPAGLILSQTASQDTATSIWTGTCGSLTQVYCSDPESSTWSGPLSPNTDYYILVSKWSNTAYAAGATISLTVDVPQPPPANDLCTNATVLSPTTPVSVTGNMTNALPTTTITPAVCASSSRDLFYSFTPTVSNNYTITTCGGTTSSTLDTVVSVHSGCPGDGSTVLACNDDNCTGGVGPSTIANFSMNAGTTYIIRVAMWNTTAGGPFTLTITSETFGSCCASDSSCTLRAQSLCTAPSTFVGNATCSTSACQGSCCTTATGACALSSPGACAGVFGGIGSTCTTVPCASVTACCNPTTGGCTITGTNPCPSGTTSNPGLTCSPNPCPQPPPPGNDDCSTVLSLPPGSVYDIPSAGGTVMGQLITATNDGSSSCQASAGLDVYYRITPVTSGYYSFSTCANSDPIDTIISIHTNSCPVSSATQIAGTGVGCVDQGCGTGNLTLIPAAPLTGGQTYLIRVALWSSTTATGAFTLAVTPTSAGACCSSTGGCTTTVPSSCTGTSVYQGDNTTCTPNPCGGACCNTTAGTCSTTTAAACTGAFRGLGTTCTPNPCGGACCDPATGVCTITTDTGCTGNFQGLGVACTTGLCPPPPPPANDECSGATPVTLGTASFNGVGATTSFTLSASGCNSTLAGAGGFEDVFHSFVAPATADYTLDTCGSGFDTTLAIFSGACPVDESTLLACNDDSTANTACSSSGLHSRIPLVSLVGGQTYIIRVAHYGTGTGTATSSPYTLTIAYVGTVGSCCSGTSCRLTNAANCSGTYTDGASCTPNPCAPASTICCRGATCTVLTSGTCTTTGTTQAGAFSAGAGTACNVANNNTSPCCKADYNKVGGVELLDIFAFLNDWFNNVSYADFNQQNGVDLLDIFAFLGAWFAGGC